MVEGAANGKRPPQLGARRQQEEEEATSGGGGGGKQRGAPFHSLPLSPHTRRGEAKRFPLSLSVPLFVMYYLLLYTVVLLLQRNTTI